MVVDSDERMARIHDLTMKHQSNIHEMDLVNRDEQARQLKLRVLSLRDDNAILSDQISQKDARVRSLHRQYEDVRTELDQAKRTAKSQDARLQKQNKELTELKAELESLNGSMQDSGKTLQEKFALTRELDRLRPELEHLKSQLANHQAVVAEKLNLQRQLDSVEVELENEKRSKEKQRSKKKSEDQAAEEWKSKFEALEKKYTSEKKEWKKSEDQSSGEWKSKFEAAEKKHILEKKEWEKAKKEHGRELREVQGENERLEERILTMKSKLKNTQTELKSAEAELEKCQAELEAAKTAAKTTGEKPKKKVTVKAQPTARKRRANEMTLEDITIGTPGPKEAAKRPTKKRGAEKSLVGEKSTFSITPFLNRTKNLSDESMEEASPTGKVAQAPEPIIEEEEEEAAEEVAPVAQVTVPEISVETKKPAPKAQKARGRAKAKALADAPTTKKNMPAPSSEKTETIVFGPKLDIVTEASESQEQENVPVRKLKKGPELKAKTAEARIVANTSILDADGKKKKRKLLGGATKTLFDEEDGEVAPKPPKAQLGPTKRFRANLGGGVSNAFAGATFSPLKRDRRGVNASFLA